jgi:hypothetical protein
VSSARSKYVDHTVRCAGCGDVLIEIFTPMVTGEVVIGHRSVQLDLSRPEEHYKPARRRAREWSHTTHTRMNVYGKECYSPSEVTSTCGCTYRRHFDVAELLTRAGKKSTEPTTPATRPHRS